MKIILKSAVSALVLSLVAGAAAAAPLPPLSATVDQTGASQEANVTQAAATGTVTVVQSTNGNRANVTQSGSSAAAIAFVKQVGDRGTVNVT